MDEDGSLWTVRKGVVGSFVSISLAIVWVERGQ